MRLTPLSQLRLFNKLVLIVYYQLFITLKILNAPDITAWFELILVNWEIFTVL